MKDSISRKVNSEFVGSVFIEAVRGIYPHMEWDLLITTEDAVQAELILDNNVGALTNKHTINI